MEQYSEVFFSNEEYYRLTDGQPATAELCKDVITYCPDNFPEEKIQCIGVSHNHTHIAVLSILEGYPDDDVLYVGLLLINEKTKKQGWGTRVMRALLEAASDGVFHSARLSVQDNNIPGLNFWQSLSFQTIDQCNCGHFYNLSMERKLN